MKKVRVILIVVVTLFIMLYAFAYLFVIPNAAEAAMPYKWKYVFPGLKQNEYHVYLGRTAENTTGKLIDNWVVRNDNYTFYLDINYDKDTIANTINMHYSFSNFLFRKEGVIARKAAQ